MEEIGFGPCPKCGSLEYNPGMTPRPCAQCAAEALGLHPRGRVPKGQACPKCRRVPTYACPDMCRGRDAHKPGPPIGSLTTVQVIRKVKRDLGR